MNDEDAYKYQALALILSSFQSERLTIEFAGTLFSRSCIVTLQPVLPRLIYGALLLPFLYAFYISTSHILLKAFAEFLIFTRNSLLYLQFMFSMLKFQLQPPVFVYHALIGKPAFDYNLLIIITLALFTLSCHF